MTIELNGERIEIEQGSPVAVAIERAGARPDRRGVAVAVAVDGEVVPRSAWHTTPLRDGQRVEVVGAIQGG
jgi:sulfur carrier protein